MKPLIPIMVATTANARFVLNSLLAVLIVCSSCMAPFDWPTGDGPIRLGRKLSDDGFLRRGVHFGIHLVESVPYRHYVFDKRKCEAHDGDPLFVYLDGDGNSWVRDGLVSEDPTPPDPVALDLLGLDGSCGIYISRPCTFGLMDQDPACVPRVWTIDRYSPQVLSSLEGVIDRVVPRERPIVLVGYSGGGLLASHLSHRIGNVVGLITLGANLDLPAWVAHHRYMPEVAASAPDSPFPLQDRVTQLHAFGEADLVAPSTVATTALDPAAREAVVLLENVDHTCCWLKNWPGLLEIFQQRIDRSVRSRSSSSTR